MEIFIIDKPSSKEIFKQMFDYRQKIKQIGYLREIAIVVGGEQLTKILKKHKGEKLLKEFIKLAKVVSVVLACRVSPKQKAEVVTMVRQSDKNVTSLAIGDGANDVNMITAAHIGIGISGLEGQQAARAADYAIGQFKFLKNLLFVHGREAYRRNSYLIIYMFYKNVVYVLPIFYFGFVS